VAAFVSVRAPGIATRTEQVTVPLQPFAGDRPHPLYATHRGALFLGYVDALYPSEGSEGIVQLYRFYRAHLTYRPWT
jgi:hypothetical protein